MESFDTEKKKQALARLMAQKGLAAKQGTRIESRADVLAPIPLSFAQQRLWFLEQLEPGQSIYHLPFLLRLSGPVHAGALEQSINEIVRRHEALRTRFVTLNDEPRQIVQPTQPIPLTLVDLQGRGQPEQARELRWHLDEAIYRPFSLTEGPLLRAMLVALGPQDHLLLITMHHIVSDGWSQGVFFQELAALYGAFCAGAPSPLPSLPIQYGDFALWQREWLTGETLDRQLDYWRKQLAGVPVLELPTDHPRPARQSYNGAWHRFQLPRALTEKVHALSKETGGSLFMTLLAAFQHLLARYSGQDDIAVGTPIANRNRSEIGSLIGFFVNTLVLRSDLSGDPSFRELLGRVREVALEAYAHQDVPFEKLVEVLQPERNLSHTPLFQVMLILQNATSTLPALPGLSVTRAELELDNPPALFDLTMNLEESEEGIQGILVYNRDLFDASSVERLAAHYQRLLEQAVAEPTRPLSRLSLLSAEEQRHLLAWQGDSLPWPRDKSLAALFEQQVAARPDALALQTASGQALTYDALNRRANQVAHQMKARGVGPGVPVALCIARSPEAIIGLLAILKAGGIYVPLDPSYPEERLTFLLHDAQARLILTQQALVERLSAMSVPLVALDGSLDAQRDDNPPSVATPEDIAYLIYTSGSTGQPKGVLVPQRAIVAHCAGVQAAYELAPEDRILQFASLSFDASLEQILPPLLSGACIVLRDEEVWSPAELRARLDTLRLTILNLPTAYWRWVAQEWAAPEARPAQDSLRLVIVGGEAMPAHALRAWQQTPWRNVRLLNAYGPTEATITATLFEVPPGYEDAPALLPIGRPLPNRTIYLLDQALQPVPSGVPGELYIGGESLAQGYLNRPDLTAERFVTLPFAGQARAYRTGDRVRARADGTLEFLGRTDDQIKIRGFRIEVGEVEAALALCPGVRESAVLAQEEQGERYLAAYLVPQPGETLTPETVRAFLLTRLPEYMIPAAFVLLEQLPVTVQGKVDRRALPRPERLLPLESEHYVAPRTPTEESVASLWAGVLGVAQVGVHDNFFNLGGHSLKASQLISRVRDAFQITLPLRTLFEEPTVAGLAQAIEEARAEKPAGSQRPTLRPYPREGALPLSYSQERLWFLNQLEPASAAYNLPTLFRLRGSLDLTVLERSLSEIVRRHEVLRTVYATEQGRPMQLILAPQPVEIKQIDVTEAQVEQTVLAEVERPFDIARGPLLHASLLCLAPTDHILLLTIHHIATDGWSVALMVQELAALYNAFSQGSASPLAELPLQYIDFALWQREWLAGTELERQLGYWREQLAGAPALLELPTDYPRPPVQGYRGGIESLLLSESLSAQLKALGQQEGTTLFMTLLAAFKLLLHRLTGQEDIVVGSPVAGRNQSEIESLIGFFLNTLALRTTFGEGLSFRQLLRQVREVALGAYAHQDIPFERLLEALQPPRSLSYSPLFQVFFNMLNLPERVPTLTGLEVEEFPLSEIQAKFDLTLYSELRDERIELSMVYNADLFKPERMAEMMRQLHLLLQQVIAQPDKAIGKFSLVTPTARAALPDPLQPLSDSWEGPTHAQLTAHARRAPTRLAVRDAREQWSYEALDAMSNRLAHALLAAGIQSQEVVAIYAHRSAPLVWALMGVMKAGAAFVILDPAYPASRLVDIIESAQPRGWLQIEAAGPLPNEVERALSALAPRCRLALPAQALEGGFLADQSPAAPEVLIGPDDLACLGFTSGSTGKPKGIEGRQGALTHFYPWMREHFGLTETDCYSMVSGLSHDPLQRDILTALWMGASISIPDPEQMGNPGWLASWFQKEAITVANLTPAMERLLTETSHLAAGGLPALRYAFFVGEMLTMRNVARLAHLAPNVTCINLYGTTETQRALSYFVLPGMNATDAPLATIPVGKGFQDAQLLVLNPAGELAGIGERGEIFFRSPHLARGYLADAALTQERFLTNPFTGQPADRLYRSGDLGHYLPGGDVKALGRADDQVKIRGFRVELGEIEAALGRYPGVRAAVVLLREAETTGERILTAYIVPEAGVTLESNEVRGYLKGQLPDYMVPPHLLFLDSLPLTPNGKVDRRALPTPDALAHTQGTDFVAPRTETEETIAEIWESLLGQQPISVQHNFFDLGGHSLLATQVLSRINDAFEIELPLRTLFESPTVEALANAVEAWILAEIEALDEEEARLLLNQ